MSLAPSGTATLPKWSVGKSSNGDETKRFRRAWLFLHGSLDASRSMRLRELNLQPCAGITSLATEQGPVSLTPLHPSSPLLRVLDLPFAFCRQRATRKRLDWSVILEQDVVKNPVGFGRTERSLASHSLTHARLEVRALLMPRRVFHAAIRDKDKQPPPDWPRHRPSIIHSILHSIYLVYVHRLPTQ